MGSIASDKIRKEFKELGFRKGVHQYVCLNRWTDAVRKTEKRCYWESPPANGTYLQTLMQKGKMYCPECAKRQKTTTKGQLDIRNLKLIPYIPTFITLACSGSIKRTLLKHDGVPYHKVEPCGKRFGTLQLNDAKRKLREGELKCACGSRRFHLIEGDVPQANKLVEVIKSGQFRHLEAYYEDLAGHVKDVVKESFKVE